MAFPRNLFLLLFSEAAAHKCYLKQVLSEILQYSLENILQPATLLLPHLKRDFNKVIPVKIVIFLQTAIYMEHLQWLLLSD